MVVVVVHCISMKVGLVEVSLLDVFHEPSKKGKGNEDFEEEGTVVILVVTAIKRRSKLQESNREDAVKTKSLD